MTAPGTHALSPVSAAIKPSIDPLPNFSFSLLARFAAAYDDHAATSSPTPGRMPMNVPMTPERRIVRQYFVTSTSFGITESNGLIFTGIAFSRTDAISSAMPNAPTSAGTSCKPPARSRLPQVKRSYA
jgi:hypothetical protein